MEESSAVPEREDPTAKGQGGERKARRSEENGTKTDEVVTPATREELEFYLSKINPTNRVAIAEKVDKDNPHHDLNAFGRLVSTWLGHSATKKRANATTLARIAKLGRLTKFKNGKQFTADNDRVTSFEACTTILDTILDGEAQDASRQRSDERLATRIRRILVPPDSMEFRYFRQPHATWTIPCTFDEVPYFFRQARDWLRDSDKHTAKLVIASGHAEFSGGSGASRLEIRREVFECARRGVEIYYALPDVDDDKLPVRLSVNALRNYLAKRREDTEGIDGRLLECRVDPARRIPPAADEPSASMLGSAFLGAATRYVYLERRSPKKCLRTLVVLRPHSPHGELPSPYLADDAEVDLFDRWQADAIANSSPSPLTP